MAKTEQRRNHRRRGFPARFFLIFLFVYPRHTWLNTSDSILYYCLGFSATLCGNCVRNWNSVVRTLYVPRVLVSLRDHSGCKAIW